MMMNLQFLFGSDFKFGGGKFHGQVLDSSRVCVQFRLYLFGPFTFTKHKIIAKTINHLLSHATMSSCPLQVISSFSW